MCLLIIYNGTLNVQSWLIEYLINAIYSILFFYIVVTWFGSLSRISET